jgi:hypothetical protein
MLFPGGVTAAHREHVTTWWCEILGGPAAYTEKLGGYPAMLAGPELRAAPIGYLESAPGSPCTTPSPAPTSPSGLATAQRPAGQRWFQHEPQSVKHLLPFIGPPSCGFYWPQSAWLDETPITFNRSTQKFDRTMVPSSRGRTAISPAATPERTGGAGFGSVDNPPHLLLWCRRQSSTYRPDPATVQADKP